MRLLISKLIYLLIYQINQQPSTAFHSFNDNVAEVHYHKDRMCPFTVPEKTYKIKKCLKYKYVLNLKRPQRKDKHYGNFELGARSPKPAPAGLSLNLKGEPSPRIYRDAPLRPEKNMKTEGEILKPVKVYSANYADYQNDQPAPEAESEDLNLLPEHISSPH